MKRAAPAALALQTDLKPIALFFVALLAARILAIISVYFFEEDEVSLAVGVAAMVADTSGNVYRYAVQLGYYRLVEFIDLLLESRIDAIPWIMKGLSALAGACIPAVGFFAFKEELTIRERWFAAATLALNPIIWRSSQYGNTAIVSTGLATAALVILSNRPHRLALAGALGLIGMATFVRADAVLLMPLVFYFLRRTGGSTAYAIKVSAAFGLIMALLYGAVFLLDPRVDSVVRALTKHMLEMPNQTMFWEYLLWAMSPFPFVFAIVGLRNLMNARMRVVACLAIWCVPTLLFYFRGTVTCRYLLNAAVPLSIAGAVGMADLVDTMRRSMRASFAWTTIVVFSTLHLFLALGRLSPTRPMELFYGGTFTTLDGPMPTGALLVRSYLTPGSLMRGLPRPEFGKHSYPFWEGVAFNKATSVLAASDSPRRNVIMLLSGGWAHAFHFHTHAAGAKYLTGSPASSVLWGGEIWMQLGNSHVMTVAFESPSYKELNRLDVKAGDLVWLLGGQPFPNAEILAKLPAGLTLTPTETFDPHFQTFQVARTNASGL